MIRRRFDALDGLYLSRSELSVHAFSQQVHEADNGIERSPELVRNVRQELALHSVYTKELRGEAFELLRSLYETPRLASLMPKDQSKAKYSRKGNDPTDQASPTIDPDLRKR